MNPLQGLIQCFLHIRGWLSDKWYDWNQRSTKKNMRMQWTQPFIAGFKVEKLVGLLKKIHFESKAMEVWKTHFIFKWVILRWTMLIFQGVFWVQGPEMQNLMASVAWTKPYHCAVLGSPTNYNTRWFHNPSDRIMSSMTNGFMKPK